MKTLLTESQLLAKVDELARQLNADYSGRPVTLISVLNGSVIFAADLMRRLTMPMRLGVVRASSYRGTATSAGQLTVEMDLLPDIRGHDVILVDDIFDSGQTLLDLDQRLKQHGAGSVRSVVLLRKEGRQEHAIEPDYVGFVIPDHFVIGYGMDFDDLYRNLPYVAILDAGESVSGHSVLGDSVSGDSISGRVSGRKEPPA